MEILELNKRSDIGENKRLAKKYEYFEKLIIELKNKEIPPEIVTIISEDIEKVNLISGSNKDLAKQISKAISNIFKLIEKELKLVPKKLYLARWMAIGMSAFGVSLGVAFGAVLDNMAFLGIGIPIGMVIGMAIGAGMDKKAQDEGRQLDLEMKY